MPAGPATAPADRWGGGDAYERFIGRWSRPVAAEFLAWLNVAPGGRWLDVGCGTGALSAAILAHAGPAAITGIDPAAGFVEHARRVLASERARFEVGDAQAIDAPDSAFDAAVSGLVLNFVPSPGRAVAEMARVTRPGGTVAWYVWDYAGGMQYLRRFWDAAVALDPAAAVLDEGPRFPICRAEALVELARGAGLAHIEHRAIDAPMRFADFDDYWTPFLGGQGPAPTYVASLDAGRREALREEVRRRLPVARDGSIDLIASAWAVRGRP
jgi:SAM-dependent methyltransferase